MVLVDANGLPVAVETVSATPHESRLVQGLFEFMLSSERPARIVGVPRTEMPVHFRLDQGWHITDLG